MKHLFARLGLALTIAFSLSAFACTSGSLIPPQTAGTIVQTGNKVIMAGDKAFALAEVGYTALAQTAAGLIRAGVIKPGTPLFQRIKAINARAEVLLPKGRAALGNVEKARIAAELLLLNDDLDTIASGHQ